MRRNRDRLHIRKALAAITNICCIEQVFSIDNLIDRGKDTVTAGKIYHSGQFATGINLVFRRECACTGIRILLQILVSVQRAARHTCKDFCSNIGFFTVPIYRPQARTATEGILCYRAHRSRNHKCAESRAVLEGLLIYCLHLRGCVECHALQRIVALAQGLVVAQPAWIGRCRRLDIKGRNVCNRKLLALRRCNLCRNIQCRLA